MYPAQGYNDTVPLLPPVGMLYHGVFAPVYYPKNEMAISTESIRSYENASGKNIAIGAFSSEWSVNRSFPYEEAEIVRQNGAIPYIRLMLRSDIRQYRSEPLFTLNRIRDGHYDPDLSHWAAGAANFGTPIIVEWGTEVNGRWFPWNGYWNGDEDGPQKFRDAYRHIIDLMRKNKADNLIWVFHLNWNSVPAVYWNNWSEYYPGDDYIDWIGVSVYGALHPESDSEGSFTEKMDTIYPEIGSGKPVFISEFGTYISSETVNSFTWTEDALRNITTGRWPNVIGFCWWNTEWPNDRISSHNTTMRIDNNSEMKEIFRKYIGMNGNITGKMNNQ